MNENVSFIVAVIALFIFVVLATGNIVASIYRDEINNAISNKYYIKNDIAKYSFVLIGTRKTKDESWTIVQ